MDKLSFLRTANQSWKMRLFMLRKLPAAWFMGVRVLSCTEEQAQVALPYGWRSQNPFRSTYFAAQCAAGEMSTGLLALAAMSGKPPVSMLVTHIEASFHKKVNQTLVFTCTQGRAVEALIEKTLADGQGYVLKMESVGTLPDGTVACTVGVTWSFRRKEK